MRQTITKTVVDGLHPNNSEYTIWDEKLPGFGIRVGPSDAKSFIVVYRAGTGRTAPTKRYTIAAVGKMEPDQARNQAKILLGVIAGGSDPAAEKRAKRPRRDRIKFDELARLYLNEYAKPRKSSWKNDEGYLKRARDKWKRRIAARDLIRALNSNTAYVAATNFNDTLSVFSGSAQGFGRGHRLASRKRRICRSIMIATIRWSSASDIDLNKLAGSLPDRHSAGASAPPSETALRSLAFTDNLARRFRYQITTPVTESAATTSPIAEIIIRPSKPKIRPL
jgi:hypothetical protein